jgi:hypothetical protein
LLALISSGSIAEFTRWNPTNKMIFHIWNDCNWEYIVSPDDCKGEFQHPINYSDGNEAVESLDFP